MLVGEAVAAAFGPIPDVASDAAPAWLTREEEAVFCGLRFPKRRREWLAGRQVAKVAVARLGGRAARPRADVEVTTRPSGAPEALVSGASSPVALTLAHAGEVAGALAWAAERCRYGLDLEPLRPLDLRLHDVALAPAERAWALAEPGREVERTLALWTAKESVLKVLELGLRADLRTVLVEPEPGAPVWRAVVERRSAFRVRHVVRGGYVVAVATPWSQK